MPEILDVGRESLGRIVSETKKGAAKTENIVGKTVDGITGGAVQVVAEAAFHLPKNLILKPVASTLTKWVKTGVGYALAYSWEGLKRVPLLPFTTRNSLSTPPYRVTLPSDAPPSPPPLPSAHPDGRSERP